MSDSEKDYPPLAWAVGCVIFAIGMLTVIAMILLVTWLWRVQ